MKVKILLAMCLLFFSVNAQATPLSAYTGSGINVTYDKQGTHFLVPISVAFQNPAQQTFEPEFVDELYRLASALMARPHRAVGIRARYQSVLPGPDARRLSLQLASRMADFLTDAGVAPDRIAFIQGDSRVAVLDGTNAVSRSIDVVLLPKAY